MCNFSKNLNKMQMTELSIHYDVFKLQAPPLYFGYFRAIINLTSTNTFTAALSRNKLVYTSAQMSQ